MIAQARVAGEHRRFGPSCAGIGPGLGHRCPVARLSANRAAGQFPTNRRRRPAQSPRDRSDTFTSGPINADLFPFREREPRHSRSRVRTFSRTGREHTASLAEPTPGHGLRHADRRRGVVQHDTGAHHQPEPPLQLQRERRSTHHGHPLQEGVAMTVRIRPACSVGKCPRARTARR